MNSISISLKVGEGWRKPSIVTIDGITHEASPGHDGTDDSDGYSGGGGYGGCNGGTNGGHGEGNDGGNGTGEDVAEYKFMYYELSPG